MTITLHTWTLADKPALIALCNAVDRTFLTGRLPYPYTEADADWWLEMVAENEGKEGLWRAIQADGNLVGSISIERKEGQERGIGKLGYIILTPWWSRGIGTEAVRQLCRIAFDELGLQQISATVFVGNRASERVLEKNGFRLDETKAESFVKDGKPMIMRCFVLV